MNTEEFEQRKVVKYLDEMKLKGVYVKFTAIPNSTYTESFAAKAKNIHDGLRRGLPDLFIILNKKCFFIEMKSKKGVVSLFQKKWIDSINQSTGVKAYVCYSSEEAINLIQTILSGQVLPENAVDVSQKTNK